MQGQRGQAGVDAHVRADRAVEAAAAAAGQRQDELARAAPRVEPGHLAAPGLLLVLVVPAADVLDLAHVVVLDDRLPQRARLLRLRLGPLLPALPALALLVLLARVQVLLEPVHLAGRVAVLGRHAAAAALVVLQHARVARLAALAAPARRRRRPAVAGPVLLAVVLLALLLLQVVQALPIVLGHVRQVVILRISPSSSTNVPSGFICSSPGGEVKSCVCAPQPPPQRGRARWGQPNWGSLCLLVES